MSPHRTTCLLVVESPAKAKTIAGYLSAHPQRWTVLATGGHLADLPKNDIGIDEQDGRYQGRWVVDTKKRKTVEAIKQAAARADIVFIGSDDDREGERIARDIIHYARIANARRIVFTEITPGAIRTAIETGIRPLLGDRVDAQVARRLIDREVGYPISRIIRWDFKRRNKPLPNGVGRVISPALHLLAENDRQIATFVPEPYQRIAVDYRHAGIHFRALHVTKFTADESVDRDALLHTLQAHPHVVYSYERKTKDVSPYPPFITSRLLRSAFYLYGFDPKKTMGIAQQLYEGVDTADGRMGLISYPRTDSYALSDEACADILSLLATHLGDDAALTMPRMFPDEEHAQAAHEAIRPTGFREEHWPRSLRAYLTDDQFRLYEAIWYRTLATQMPNSVYDVSELVVDIDGEQIFVKANQRIYDGWESLDGGRAEQSEREGGGLGRTVVLPELEVGTSLHPLDVRAIDLTTKAPPRYGVGRFLTLLDNKGIARPSTLDGIVPGLERKGYIAIRQGMVYVSPLGLAVNEWTSEHAGWLNDPDAAREFEETLDAVEQGRHSYNSLVADYAKRVQAIQVALGYWETEVRRPSEAQLALAQRLVDRDGTTIPDAVANDRVALGKFIDAHTTKLGHCPACRKGAVVAYEKKYACDRQKCDFVLWRSSVQRFIDHFAVAGQDQDAMTRELLKRNATLYRGLRGKENRVFDARVGIAYASDHRRWGVEIVGFERS